MDLNFAAVWPEAIVVLAGLVLLLLEAILPAERPHRAAILGYTAVAGFVVALASLPFVLPPLAPGEGVRELAGMISVDGFGAFFRAVLLMIGALIVLGSIEYVQREDVPAGEFFSLLAFAIAGAMFMVIAANILTFYIGFELLSIASYAMAGLLRRDPRSGEASLKYFLNGAVASAILLFGLSFLYGITQATDLVEMARGLAQALQGGAAPLAGTALALVIGGLAFKVAAAPFHLWAPDVYEGAPTPVTTFLSVGSKGATFAVLLRLFFGAFGPLSADWSIWFAILGVVSMTVGNVTALMQTNAKRMLAYSSIAHAGYILAGLAANSQLGFNAVMFYILAYAFMTITAFTGVIAVSNEDRSDEIPAFAGLARRAPILAFVVLVSMLSLIGVPPTAGFFGKLYIIRALVASGLAWLAVALAVNSAISVYYYYSLVRQMYVVAPQRNAPLGASPSLQVGLALAFVGIIALGLAPDSILQWISLSSLVP